MNTDSLTNLFNKVVEKSKKNRIDEEKFNGLGFWRKIKQNISNLNKTDYEWNPKFVEMIPRDLYESILNEIPECNSKCKTLEFNHFFIQLFRIPYTEECTLKKILQIGLNLGQFLGTLKYQKGFLANSMKKMIDDYGLDKFKYIY